MSRFSFGLLCGFLFSSLAIIPAMTQQSEQIVIGGVSLQIGMSKDAVRSRMAERGLNVQEGENEMWVVTQKNDTNEYDLVGSLNFVGSRLSWVSHRWTTSSDAGAAKLGRSLYFVLKSFEGQSNDSCNIKTNSSENPDLDSKSVVIHCGKRTATLAVATYKDQRPQAILDEGITK